MLALGVLYLSIGAGGAAFSGAEHSVPSAQLAAGRWQLAAVSSDTSQPRPRPKVVEVSEWYSRRLTIHRYVAYATLPVFGAQYLAGRELYNNAGGPVAAPEWAKTTHRVGASLLAGMFTVNTVTGLWNLWDSREAPQGRGLRTAHALMMLTADAGFTYAGVRLSKQAETDLSKRRLHHTIALSSLGLSVANGLMMKLWNK
jgi:hypothetical protein